MRERKSGWLLVAFDITEELNIVAKCLNLGKFSLGPTSFQTALRSPLYLYNVIVMLPALRRC